MTYCLSELIGHSWLVMIVLVYKRLTFPLGFGREALKTLDGLFLSQEGRHSAGSEAIHWLGLLK